jgi:diguanylate cyclase (GGDEF)-like protein
LSVIKAPEARIENFQLRLQQLDKRDWWLWGTTGVVTLLLTATITLLILNPSSTAMEAGPTYDAKNIALGLVSLVLLFNINSLYQQLLIKRLRRKLAEQIFTAAQLHLLAQKFEKLAVLDPLTGLYNRRLIEERLNGELTRSRRHGHPLAILTFDLDEFKHINDHYGHAAGDLVLKEFACRIKKAIRSSDVAARIGGDEFLAVLPECGPGHVERILSRLADLEIEFHDKRIRFTCSSGWADYRSGESLEQLLERADERLYVCKRGSKSATRPPFAPAEAGT